MPNLLENKLLLQFLSGAGAATAGEGSFAAGVNPLVQQNIQSQNYAALLKKLLGKGIDFKSDAKGKATISLENGLSALSPNLIGEGITSPEKMKAAQLPSAQPPQTGGGGIDANTLMLMNFLNPSNSQLGDLSGADLAGLTPKDISQALQFKFASDELKQKKVSDLLDRMRQGTLDPVDIAYKKALTDQALSSIETSKYGKGIELFKAMTKDERTNLIKNYEYAQSQGYKGTIEEFNRESRTSNQKDYEAAVAGGYEGSFHQWLLEMRKAGATNISIGERAKAAGEVKKAQQKAEIFAPDYHLKVAKDLEKAPDWFNPAEAKGLMEKYKISEEKAIEVARQIRVLKEMDRQIKSQYGKGITFTNEGWFKDGKLIRSNPYAR
jgi:hypothetical protein